MENSSCQESYPSETLPETPTTNTPTTPTTPTTTTTSSSITMVAKWGKERIYLEQLAPTTTIQQVKNLLTQKTKILPKRQKLMGLTLCENPKSKLRNDHVLQDLKIKKKLSKSKEKLPVNVNVMVIRHDFILMGTPEEHIFVDPKERESLPDVVDDFDFDFSAGSKEWIQHKANGDNLKKFTESTTIHIMNEPRTNKPLLVLDLDHTLLDFSSKRLQQATTYEMGASTAAAMKRPFMDQFLTVVYRHYDLVVWSQTSWKWVEVKLTELGMLTNPGYKFCFVLDKTSMFSVTSTKRDGTAYRHYVKPMQLLWSKFPNRWGPHNTVHLDDLSRNFALNIDSGLKVTAYHRKKSSASRDLELSGLSVYLSILANDALDFEIVDFRKWVEVVKGTSTLSQTQRPKSNKK